MNEWRIDVAGDIWNRCDYCGRFIGFLEFSGPDKTAQRRYISPDAEGIKEKYETFHFKCAGSLTPCSP